MIGKTAAIAFALLFTASGWADTLALREGHPDRYVVRKGDTLWDISGRFLEHPWRWPELWDANPQIDNPHLIYPGDVLTLVWRDGQPRLVRAGRGRPGPGQRLVKLSPEIRVEPHASAIAALPLDAVEPFLTRPRVATEAELDAAPYVVAGEEAHLVTGSEARAYVRGLDADPGTRFTVVRRGAVYRDPDADGAIIGYEALPVADAVVVRAGDPATIEVTHADREVLVGDRLLPREDVEFRDFIPHAPPAGVSGRVISAIDALSQIGQHQVVVLNVGAEDGVEPGHVLGIYRSGQVVRDYIGVDERDDGPIRFENEEHNVLDRIFGRLFTDIRDNKRALDRALGVDLRAQGEEVTLPEERTGDLMVFRTFDQVSYALVMEIVRPVHILDAVRHP